MLHELLEWNDLQGPGSEMRHGSGRSGNPRAVARLSKPGGHHIAIEERRSNRMNGNQKSVYTLCARGYPFELLLDQSISLAFCRNMLERVRLDCCSSWAICSLVDFGPLSNPSRAKPSRSSNRVLLAPTWFKCRKSGASPTPPAEFRWKKQKLHPRRAT